MAVGWIVLGATAIAAPNAVAQSPSRSTAKTGHENAAQQPATKKHVGAEASEVERKVEQIAASGRIQQIGLTSSERLNPTARLAPGTPPILAFRYIDGQARHRFGDLDLVMDDAGH